MTFACSSAVVYVLYMNVVHSIERRSRSSSSDTGGCIPIIDGNGPFAGVSFCSKCTSVRGERLSSVKTYLERPFDGPLCRGDRDTLHVEPVLARTRQCEPPFCGIGGELEGGQEHGVALDGVVAQRARVHRDELALAGGL